jgi:8-oxo-dGTP pyrophosphatase MutT (NUDIX family)
MVRRSQSAVFMGGARVFPGGALEDVDDTPLARAAVRWDGDDEEFPWRAAALRELFEEAGVVLGSDATIDSELRGPAVYEALLATGGHFDANALEYFANWVTPMGPPRRYDARFYVGRCAEEVVTDDSEVFEAEWVSPAEALSRAQRDEWILEFPTRVALESLEPHPSTSQLMAAAAEIEVRKIAPRLGVGADGELVVLLPGDAGFEEAPA